MNELICRLCLLLAAPPRDERGDVPGWVLITVMTAGIVGGLWTFADGQLQSMLAGALNSVRP